MQKFTTKGEYVGMPAFTCLSYGKEYPLHASHLLTIDASGNFYLPTAQYCDYGCASITKYSSSYNYLLTLSNYNEVNDTCFFSIKSTVDIGPVGPDGCVYTLDEEDDTAILKFTPNGLPTKWDNTQLESPNDMKVDADGYVYVLDLHYSDHTYRIMKYTADGELLGFFTLTQTSGYNSMTVYRIAIDSKGNIYAYDDYSQRIQVYSPEGALMTVYKTNWIGRNMRDIGVDGEDVVYFLVMGKWDDPTTISKFTLEDAGFVVNTTSDESDADNDDGVCDVDLSEDGDQCTLRAAIEEVNLSTDVDTITFDIPTTDYGYSSNTGTVTFTISPKKPLPGIEKAVVIDATSQPNGTVVLNGKNAGKASGISTKDKDCTIKGMHIQNFSSDGIKAKSDVFLKNTKVSSNKGSGVSSSTDITIEGTDNEFSDNGKSGIYSGGDMRADVIQVENNGGYGISAKEAVFINGMGSSDFNTIPYPGQISKISNNGLGGIRSAGNGEESDIGGSYLEVVGNGQSADKDAGYGIYAYKGHVWLNFSKVNKNKGGGIIAAHDGVQINGTGNEVSDNGIKTGKSGISGLNVSAGVIQVENNGGYGISAKGDVSINAVTQYEGGPKIAYYTDISKIGNNGKDGILAKKDLSGLEGGSVEAFYLNVINNKGAGIRAESDLTLSDSYICDNAGGNLAVKGTKNLTNVTVCESVLSATTQGNAMLDTEMPDNGNGCPEDEEPVELNTGDDAQR